MKLHDLENGGKLPWPRGSIYLRSVSGYSHKVGGISVDKVGERIVCTAGGGRSNEAREDVQEIAAAQVALLSSYYDTAFAQAHKSFIGAAVAAVVGLAFFIVAVVSLLTIENLSVAIVSVVSGAIVEVIAVIIFFLYRKSTAQLGDFQHDVQKTARFLLANSVCEVLEGEEKQKTRAALVRDIATM